jgi:hypothetical protein
MARNTPKEAVGVPRKSWGSQEPLEKLLGSSLEVARKFPGVAREVVGSS